MNKKIIEDTKELLIVGSIINDIIKKIQFKFLKVLFEYFVIYSLNN